MSSFAPRNADGLNPYVVTKCSWGREYSQVEYAASLKDAKNQFG